MNNDFEKLLKKTYKSIYNTDADKAANNSGSLLKSIASKSVPSGSSQKNLGVTDIKPYSSQKPAASPKAEPSTLYEKLLNYNTAPVQAPKPAAVPPYRPVNSVPKAQPKAYNSFLPTPASTLNSLSPESKKPLTTYEEVLRDLQAPKKSYPNKEFENSKNYFWLKENNTPETRDFLTGKTSASPDKVSEKIKSLQHALNTFNPNFTSYVKPGRINSEPLKHDGIWGPKTQSAMDIFMQGEEPGTVNYFKGLANPLTQNANSAFIPNEFKFLANLDKQADDEKFLNEDEIDYSDPAFWIERAKNITDYRTTLDKLNYYYIGLIINNELTKLFDKSKLKPAEKSLALSKPIEAGILYLNKANVKAETARNLIYKDFANVQTDGCLPNAFLHGYWNALMAYYVGEETAEEFATAHEQYTVEEYNNNNILKVIDTEPTPHLTTGQNVAMDMHNNEVGRKIAKKMPYKHNSNQALIHASKELLYKYYNGSTEELRSAMKEYPGFDYEDILLLHYTVEELKNGNLIYLAE